VSDEQSLLRSPDGPSRRRAPAAAGARFDDQLAVGRDLAGLIWQHRLWWVVPLVLALLVLSVLLVLEATPVGPLLYPLF